MLLPKWIIQEDRFVIAPDFQVKIHPFVKIGIGEQGELFNGIFSLKSKPFRDKSLERISKMCFQNLNVTNDMLVELLDLFCRNPKFLVLRSADLVLFKFTDIFILHLELGHIPS